MDMIYIDEAAVDSPLAQRLLASEPADKVRVVRERPWQQGTLSAQEFDRSKRNLFVTPFRGHFFKRCPGAKPGLTCCNYFVLNLGLQCDMNCSYCYLQSFINSPILTVYSNLSDALLELEALGSDFREQKIRIGTGEVIDSLSLDPLTLYSRELIAFFRNYPQWTLELKTKSAAVDQFLDCEHARNILVSWSVNPENIIAREEHGTASLAQRLSAAAKCRERQFPVAFHIDPMIWHPEWRESYGGLVDQICAQFRPSDVNTISLGALRFQPEQRQMMRERFGFKSLVNQAEMFLGPDGKMRYAQELRSEMFDFVLKRFFANSRDWRVFLCMESPETWLSAYQAPAHKVESLQELFRKVPASGRFSQITLANMTPRTN